MKALCILLAALLPGVSGAQASVPTSAAPSCRADPLQGRSLYLRGSFNSWNAVETQRLTWACNRWELVTRLEGEQLFKFGDEGWSADADFGLGPAAAERIELAPRGKEIRHRFNGTHRFTVNFNNGQPQLRIEDCPQAAPLGSTTLYLRGTLNNWAALDDYALQYSCDAYYLNLKASGRHEFKIADAAWKEASSFGQGSGNFVHSFDGEHTVRLAFEGGQPKLTVGPKTFADPSVMAVTDLVALSLRFDSRDPGFKSPFGAVPAGTTVQYAVAAATGVQALTLVIEKRRLEGNQEVLAYSEVARVPMVLEGSHWRAQHRYADVAVYGHWFEAQIGGRKYALQNNADAVYWTREKGSGGRAAVADLPTALTSIRRFRQTVYDPAFKVPAWAADAIYYQIFPDRFRNGDPKNDPKPGVARYQNHTVELHKDWNQRPFRPGSGDGSDAVYNNDFFGGDLAGIIEKLDHLRELGVNTLYLTPIFKAASNHKYDTADYREVDPAFGSNTDFTRLTQEATKRGLRVLPDTSFNHVGSDSIYFNRYGNHGKQGAFQGGRINAASPYASWFSFDPRQTDADKQFKGWVGTTDLPELDKNSRALRQFFFGGKDSVTQLWLDRGAAGWRMDVAPWVPDDFWREWRKAVKAHRPDAITVAETWFDASKYFLGDMFDSTMNYIFRNAVLDYAAGGAVAPLVANLELTREAYPPQALHALMNLISSHDQARALHVLGWHDGEMDPAVIKRAKARFKLATFWQMTFPGAPSIYYGDEVGVTGGDDPYNRATYPWADLGGKPDLALQDSVRQLVRLRNDNPVLRRGELLAPLLADGSVVVLARRLASTWALVATNNAETPQRVTVTLPAVAPAVGWRDALAADPASEALTASQPLSAGGRTLSIEVPPLFGRVLITR